MSEDSASPLTELQAPDEMALVFNPIGFGGRMEPEDAARFQKEAIAAATLADAVPTNIKENFERARRLHLYGVLEYEFFTAAPEYALLVLEAALRVRFITYYDHQVPVFRGEEVATLPAADFDAVREARIGRRSRLRQGSHRVEPCADPRDGRWATLARLAPIVREALFRPRQARHRAAAHGPAVAEGLAKSLGPKVRPGEPRRRAAGA